LVENGCLSFEKEIFFGQILTFAIVLRMGMGLTSTFQFSHKWRFQGRLEQLYTTALLLMLHIYRRQQDHILFLYMGVLLIMLLLIILHNSSNILCTCMGYGIKINTTCIHYICMGVYILHAWPHGVYIHLASHSLGFKYIHIHGLMNELCGMQMQEIGDGHALESVRSAFTHPAVR